MVSKLNEKEAINQCIRGVISKDKFKENSIRVGIHAKGLTKEELEERIISSRIYLHLSKLEELKNWINEKITTEITTIEEMLKYLKNGILLAEIAVACGWKCKVHRDLKFRYFEIENIFSFLNFLKTTKVDSNLFFDTVDLREEKNIPKVVLCLLTLAKHLKNGDKHLINKDKHLKNGDKDLKDKHLKKSEIKEDSIKFTEADIELVNRINNKNYKDSDKDENTHWEDYEDSAKTTLEPIKEVIKKIESIEINETATIKKDEGAIFYNPQSVSTLITKEIDSKFPNEEIAIESTTSEIPSSEIKEQEEVFDKKEELMTKEKLVIEIINSCIKTLTWKKGFESLIYKSGLVSVSALRRFIKVRPQIKEEETGISSETMEIFRENYKIQLQIENIYREIRLLINNQLTHRGLLLGNQQPPMNDYSLIKKVIFLLIHNYELLIELSMIEDDFPFTNLFGTDVMGELNFTKFIYHFRKFNSPLAFSIAVKQFKASDVYKKIYKDRNLSKEVGGEKSSKKIKLPIYLYLFNLKSVLDECNLSGYLKVSEILELNISSIQDICSYFIPKINYSDGLKIFISCKIINKLLLILNNNLEYLSGEIKRLVVSIGDVNKKPSEVECSKVDISLNKDNILEGSSEIAHLPAFQGEIEDSLMKNRNDSLFNLKNIFMNKRTLVNKDLPKNESDMDEMFLLELNNYYLEGDDYSGLIILQKEVKQKLIDAIVHSNKNDILEIIQESSNKEGLNRDLEYLEKKGITFKSKNYEEILEMIVYDILLIQEKSTQVKLIKETSENVTRKNFLLNKKMASLQEYLKCHLGTIVRNKESFFNKTSGPESNYGTYTFSLKSFNAVVYETFSPEEASIRISSNTPCLFKIELTILNIVLAEIYISLGELLKMKEERVAICKIGNMAGLNVNSIISTINEQYIIQ